MALAFRNAIASPGANPGRAVACASGLDEDRLIDIRNDEGAGSSCECNSAIGCYMSTKNSNCVECCTPNGAYKAPAPDSSVAAPKKGGVGYLVAKRVFDIAFSAGVCLVLAVPVAVACAAICVDTPGSHFLGRSVLGREVRRFTSSSCGRWSLTPMTILRGICLQLSLRLGGASRSLTMIRVSPVWGESCDARRSMSCLSS